MVKNKDVSEQAAAILSVLEDKLGKTQKKTVIAKAKKLNQDIKDHALLIAAGAFCVGYLIGKFRK